MRDSFKTIGVAPEVLGYRPDIDGMRAVAVLAVIAFHINKHLLPGGFVGVDVFFVISGYLISAHIFSAAGRGEFSFGDFYFRRVRRIAPAMLAVVAATLLLAQFLLLPDDANAVSKSAVWSLASLTNVYFWLFQDVGYFAASSSEIPLLHLWSLSVEEQFYLIWPVIAVAMYRLRVGTQMMAMIVAIGVSTVLAQASFVDSPAFVYYMLPTRCGELLIGAILALAVVSGKTKAWVPRLAMPIALTGLAMVLASAALISENAVFPGLLALPPTIGAALIILGGGIAHNPVSRLLSAGPLRWIGNLSYPAYLWHWPLLAFYRYGYGEPGAPAGLVIFILTFLLAYLTYRFVEQPARRIPAIRWKACFVNWAVSSSALALLAVTFIYAERLLPSLGQSAYVKELAAMRAENRSTSQADYICQRKALRHQDLSDTNCAMGSGPSPAKRVLLLGDSNAAHYVGMISTFAEHGGFRFRNLTAGSCPPVIGDISAFVPVRRQVDCAASHKVWSHAIAEADILILGGTWNEYANTSPKFMPMLHSQVRQHAAAGKTVIILGKIPVIEGYDRLCKEKAIRFPFARCEAPHNEMQQSVAKINHELRRIAATLPNVRYFDIEPVICPGGICSAYGANKESLYFDKQHLSVRGSLEVGRAIHAASGVPEAFDFSRASSTRVASSR